jgi:hypothetical protein
LNESLSAFYVRGEGKRMAEQKNNTSTEELEMKTSRAMTVLRTVRFVGALAMLGAVLVGAFGYDDVLQLVGAAGGASAGILLKATHLIT